MSLLLCGYTHYSGCPPWAFRVTPRKENYMTEQVNAAAPKTLAEQIEVAQTRLNKLLRKQQVQEILNSVGVGDTASFRFGRGEKARDLSGVIAAVGDAESGGR